MLVVTSMSVEHKCYHTVNDNSHIKRFCSLVQLIWLQSEKVIRGQQFESSALCWKSKPEHVLCCTAHAQVLIFWSWSFIVRYVIQSLEKRVGNLATSSLVFPRNGVSGTSAKIPYWWHVTTQIQVVLLIGWKYAASNQKHYPDPVVTRHQYWISVLISQTSFRGETSSSVAKSRLFSQASSSSALCSLIYAVFFSYRETKLFVWF